MRGFESREADRSVPGRWIVEHYTDGGVYLVVAFELEWVDELNGEAGGGD